MGIARPAKPLSVLASLSATLLSGCVAMSVPENPTETLSSPEKMQPASHLAPPSFANTMCPPPGTAQFIMPPAKKARAKYRVPAMRYSPGDRFNISVFGSPEFSGDYVINADGMVILPFAGQLSAVGLSNAELSRRIEQSFISAGLYSHNAVKLTIRPVQYAPINITVAGAVFYPGRHAIGLIKDADKLDRMLAKFGDNPTDRFLPSALRAAGGVRPDADISKIKVVRNGKMISLDWQGALTGMPVEDLPLIDGDHIVVEEAGCFQSGLVRPSQITPPGIRVVFSNLSGPAYSNAQSIQSYQFAGSVPYGTRLLQGLVQANCVGGNFSTNAHRHAVLISRNPKTGQTEVIQRPIELLVRSADRDAINPFLMPDDAIACYDSTVSEVREVLGLVNTAIMPANTLRGALPQR